MKTKIVILFYLMTGLSCVLAYAKEGNIGRISKEVSSRIGSRLPQAGLDKGENLEKLLSQPLSVDSAVQIALWNNKSLQQALESWGIAKADFNKTRLPKNPTVGASVRFPENDEPYNSVEFTVEQDFLSLIFLPLKNNLAGAQLHKAELEITDRVLGLAFEAKAAFYEVQGAQTTASLLRRVLEQAEASSKLAQEQFAAGNINALNLANEKAVYQDARLGYLRAGAELAGKKEDLNRLMGFGGEEPAWEIKEEIGAIQPQELSYQELLTLGISKRLDLQIAKKNVEALKYSLSLHRAGMFGNPEIGIDTEKEVEGNRLTGPTLKTEVPVYDLGQTEVSRAGAELKEAELGLLALENDIRSEIKQKSEHLQALRSFAEEYKNSIIPNRAKITEEAQKHHNYMLLGNYDLIRAKQNEMLASKEYIATLTEYWIARSKLEKALSTKLPISSKVSGVESEAGSGHSHPGGHYA